MIIPPSIISSRANMITWGPISSYSSTNIVATSRLSKSAFLSTFFLRIWVTALKRQSRTDIKSSSFSWPLPSLKEVCNQIYWQSLPLCKSSMPVYLYTKPYYHIKEEVHTWLVETSKSVQHDDLGVGLMMEITPKVSDKQFDTLLNLVKRVSNKHYDTLLRKSATNTKTPCGFSWRDSFQISSGLQ